MKFGDFLGDWGIFGDLFLLLLGNFSNVPIFSGTLAGLNFEQPFLNSIISVCRIGLIKTFAQKTKKLINLF